MQIVATMAQIVRNMRETIGQNTRVHNKQIAPAPLASPSGDLFPPP